MIIGIIPARFASTRLIGKPLAAIGDKPMIQHTYESAKKSKLLEKVILAVDDAKVASVARGFGADVIETPQDIASGSDRIAFVAKIYKEADIVVNIQGDEPFIRGEMIDQAIEPLLFDKSIEVATLIKQIKTLKELKSSDIVKVVFDYNNFALYFSRSPIPFTRKAVSDSAALEITDYYKHIGLYVFRRKSLLKFITLKQTDLEKTEMLEQLRMLENGIRIKVVETEFESISVDTQEDLKRARTFYKWLQKREKEK
ncbi:MAG: 3-deoxy-manno-octulosonate cytidylyltransferase [Ignavibacteriaceae bacterium]|nr:3-deoxy-manno-octulosonate cytidylyltransferase [Ignavibacteriaceae bacterium]